MVPKVTGSSMKIIVIVSLVFVLGIVWRLLGSPTGIPTKDSSTLYTGSVKIVPLTLSEIKEQLEKQGCRENVSGVSGEAIRDCHWRETEAVSGRGEERAIKGIEIFPRGYGFGPLSFTVTETTLFAQKAIHGRPDFEKFKSEVREDVAAVSGIFTLQEDSWKKIKTTYPWDVVY